MQVTCSNCKLPQDEEQFSFRDKSKNVRKGVCKTCTYSKDYDLCQCGKKKRKVANSCQKCRSQSRIDESNYSQLTIGDKTYSEHKYAKYAYIRYYARKTAIDAGFKCCAKCGYDKHFEVCHIKAISEFPPETLLTTVNHIDNLVPLCPTHHWEFDNGLIKL